MYMYLISCYQWIGLRAVGLFLRDNMLSLFKKEICA